MDNKPEEMKWELLFANILTQDRLKLPLGSHSKLLKTLLPLHVGTANHHVIKYHTEQFISFSQVMSSS
jgi:hypothetical protein